MNAAQIFTRAGQALFGSGQDWKAQFGAALMIKPDTIDAMTKGKSRISPGIWSDLAGLLQDRAQELPTLRVKVLELVVLSSAPAAPVVTGRNPNNLTIELARDIRPEDHDAFRRSFNAFADRLGLPRGVVSTSGRHMNASLPTNLEGSQHREMRKWFGEECDRINHEG